MLQRSIAALLLALPLLACFNRRVVTTEIRNPLHAGVVDENRVAVSRAALEQQRGLPVGALDDSAVLTRLDAGGLCFELTLNRLDAVQVPNLSSYELAVDIDVDEVRIMQPDLDVHTERFVEYEGLNPVRVQSGYRDHCLEYEGSGDDRRCVRQERRPTYHTEYHPGVVRVAQGGGTICFANAGNVTTSTEQIALFVDGGVNELRFEWAFEAL